VTAAVWGGYCLFDSKAEFLNLLREAITVLKRIVSVEINPGLFAAAPRQHSILIDHGGLIVLASKCISGMSPLFDKPLL
jgi:hypothetical protein